MDALLPLLAGLITGSLGFAAWYKGRQRRRADAMRRIEAPNSLHASTGVKAREDRERWGCIDLAGLHPINQDEVRRLLAVADARGVVAISARERAFLDNMTRPRRSS